jgi:hypothetical protein
MKIKITVERSREWIAAQRLMTGDNVPESVEVDVEVSELSEPARAILLTAGRGSYPDRWYGAYNESHQWCNGGYYGRCNARIDGHAPFTPEALSDAIMDADLRLAEKRDEWKETKRQRDEERERQEAERAAKEAKITEARALLADELAALKQVKADRLILAEFLASIPNDALRGAVKAQAHSAEAVEELCKKLEDASPVYIFGEDEEDDSDE